MEVISYSGVSLEIPKDLVDDVSLLYEIISPTTWNDHLTDDDRSSLMKYLPKFKENDLEEKTRSLEMFFMDENFKFNSPLRQFHEWLSKGYFNPKIAKIRAAHKKFLHREYRLRQKIYIQNLLEDVLIRRNKVLTIAKSLPPGEVPAIPRMRNNYRSELKRKSMATIDYRTKRRYFRELVAIKTEVGSTSDLSDDDVYPEGPGLTLNKRQRRGLTGLESTLPSDLLHVRGTNSCGSLALDLELKIAPNFNVFEISDDRLKKMLTHHKARRKRREISTDLDVRDVNIQDIYNRTQYVPKRPLPQLPTSDKNKKKIKKESNVPHIFKTEQLSELSASLSSSSSSDTDNQSDDETQTISNNNIFINKNKTSPKMKRIKQEVIDPTEKSTLSWLPQPTEAKVKTEKDVIVKEEPVELSDPFEAIEAAEETHNSAAIQNSSELTAALESIGACIAPELTQEIHICFFSLIRDIICSTSDQRMTRNQLESSVRVWQESAISPINEWYNLLPSWVDTLPSAINFLCGHLSDVQPIDFVPYIEYKLSLKVYQWIGAGRDSDNLLEPLTQFWMANRSAMGNEWLEEDKLTVKQEPEDSDVIPPPWCRTTWTVQAATEAEKEAYRSQEKIRYDKPHKAFTYRTHGYESVVGPVKGIYTQQSTGPNKARGHSLLIQERPPYVTILSLVRDAVARLPNGEGTRADICELLKESQYLAPLTSSTAENNLNSVVSGALDRLHYENDPCVKYDTSRKLWIYLHRNRNEEEFERMHHLNGPGGSKNKKVAQRRQNRSKAKESNAVKPPPNVSLEPLTSTLKTDTGQHFKVKAEDIVSLAKKESINKTVNVTTSSTNIITPVVSTTTASLPSKTITSVKLGGLRSHVGVSNVQTIQVSTPSGMQTIKVALPTEAQNITKLSGQGLTKLSGLSRVSSIGQNKASSAIKSVTLNQASLQSLTGVGVLQESGKSRSPVVTLTTREAVKLPVQQIPQVVVPSRVVVTSTNTTTTSLNASSSSLVTQLSGRGGNIRRTLSGSPIVNLGGTFISSASLTKATTSIVTTSATTKLIPSILPSLGGLKVLQTNTSQPITVGKGGRGATPVMVNSSTALQTLMGQKVVMSGGKVLVQGGKVVQALAGNMSGKQVITGVLPGQQVTMESLLNQRNVTTVSGGKLSGGNLIQLTGAGGSTAGVQRLTLVSPQGTPVSLNATTQRLVLAAASQGGKVDGNKAQVIQAIQTLQPSSGSGTSGAGTSSVINTVAGASTVQPRFLTVGPQQKHIVQGVNVGGKQSVISGGIRLVQPGTATTLTGGTAGNATSNLITIGGKQVLFTTKPLASGQQAQLQQMMIASPGNNTSENKPIYSSAGTAVVVASGTSGQQIVLPIQSSHLNLKNLSAFHTLKVLPATQVPGQQRGKPVLARIVSPAAVRPVVSSANNNSSTDASKS